MLVRAGVAYRNIPVVADMVLYGHIHLFSGVNIIPSYILNTAGVCIT